ncbi:MAG TPA: ABC transporter permease [Solirubrobacterales bacterium]|jgi:peptide/nickel transport system permease protein|nr:ABC transporter permease [Solirubrobacterales bacterium]
MRLDPRQLWRRSPRATIGLGLFLLIAISAIAAPLIAPYSPKEIDVSAILQAPSSAHIFGTDEYGRDMFSRVLYGGRPTLLVASATVLASLLVGVPIGIFAGFYGGRRDLVVMRVVEFGFSLPALILAITVVAFLGGGLGNVIIALTIVYAPLLARVARAATLSVSRQPFVLAARAIGERNRTIMVKQIAPNIMSQVLVQAALVFAYAVLAEASLSFLGLGSHGPEASWGRMLKEALPLIEVAPWMGIFPGVFLALTLIGLNLMGDGLRDVLDPRARRSVEEAGAEAAPLGAQARGELPGTREVRS